MAGEYPHVVTDTNVKISLPITLDVFSPGPNLPSISFLCPDWGYVMLQLIRLVWNSFLPLELLPRAN
jgi:hypothetical protein